MKFLVLLAGFAVFAYCKEDVKADDFSTMDNIKAKAKQLYKKFDIDNDGHISFYQLSEGLKNQFGMEDDEEYLQDKKDLKRIFERFFAHKNQHAKMAQDDFEELFIHYYKNKGNRDRKNPKKQDQKLRKRAKELFDKFDKNKDQKVSLDEIKEGIKSGIKFCDYKKCDQHTQDQKSMGDYINNLFQKYVKSDKTKRDSFNRQDFYKILSQHQDKSFLQKMKDKANQIYQAIDINKDQSISYDELKKGIKHLFGYDTDKDQKDLKQSVDQIYGKYMKDQKGLTKEDIFDIIKENMKNTKDKIYQTAGDVKDKIYQTAGNVKDAIKDKISPKPKNLDELVEALLSGAQDMKQIIVDRFSQTKQSLKNIKLQDIKQKAGQLFDFLDVNNDKQVSVQQIMNAIKQRTGLKKECDSGKNLILVNLCELYHKYIQNEKIIQIKKMKFTKKEFVNLVEEWVKKLQIVKKKVEQL